MNKQQAKFYRKSFTSLVGILRFEEELKDIAELRLDLDALVKEVHSSIESYFELVEFSIYVRSSSETYEKQAQVLRHATDIGHHSLRVQEHILARRQFAQAQLAENNQLGKPHWQQWSLLADMLTAQSTLLTQLTDALVASLMRDFAISDAQH